MNPVCPDEDLPLRVALVGCGRWGRRLAQTLGVLPEFALEWVCDPRERWLGARWAPGLTTHICAAVDAVVVATPPSAHVTPALMALECRKPVFVEKPFAESLDEVRRIRAVQGEAPVMVGHLLVYHPAYVEVLAWIRRAADQGSVVIDVVRTSPPRGESRGEKRCPWWTLAPHDLALLTRALGEPEAMGVQRRGDQVVAQLMWRNARATLVYSTRASAKVRRWDVSNETHTLCYDEVTSTFSHTRGERNGAVISAIHQGEEQRLFVDVNPLGEELRHFAQCVRRSTPPLTDIHDAERSVRLLCLGERQLQAAQDRQPARVLRWASEA